MNPSIPSTLEEAVDQIIGSMTPDERAVYITGPESRAGSFDHFFGGMAMRNNWGLWHGKTGISAFLRDHRIVHGDDQSQVIFQAVWRRLKGDLSIGADWLAEQAAYYEAYWNRSGLTWDMKEIPNFVRQKVETFETEGDGKISHDIADQPPSKSSYVAHREATPSEEIKMKVFEKALRMPKEETSWVCHAWFEIKWWWENNVWNYAPRPLRFGWRTLSHWWYEQVSSRLCPRNRWLTKQIPRTWADKTSLLPSVIFAFVIHFVEDEDCFNVTDWEGSNLANEQLKLREVYAWAKNGRATFQQCIESVYPDIGPFPKNANGDMDLNAWFNQQPPPDFSEVHRLEEAFLKIDTAHMKTVIDLIPHFWT